MDTSEIWIECAHRVREEKRGQERQIVVQYNIYKNKLDILRNCKELKSTNFSAFKNFSKKPLVSERKNSKKYSKIKRMIRFLTHNIKL